MEMIEGQIIVRDEKFCIVAARFNESIVENLIRGALDALNRHGASASQIPVSRMPASA